MKLLILCFSLLSSITYAQTYELVSSKIKYTVTHKFKTTQGISTKAKGKGVCEGNLCEFLVAVETKSFDSENSNRDAHMWEIMKAFSFPIISLNLNTKKFPIEDKSLKASVTLLGQTKELDVNNLITNAQKELVKITGVVEFKLSTFNIDPPTLLTIAVEDNVPVEFETVWKKNL
jgi:polyisoprenoid-binding protein YceI